MSSAMRQSLTAYDDLATTDELCTDCREADSRLALSSVDRGARRSTPSIRFEDFPQGLPKRDIDMLAAARRIAHALDLELD